MHQRQSGRRLAGIADVLDEYRKAQVATAKKDSFLNGRVAAYVQHSAALWDALGKRFWAKRRFHLYGAKKRVLDTFAQSLVPTRRDPRPVIVGYGAANYASGGRGERSTPVQRVRRIFSQKVPTIFVDEMNSTKMCADCRLPMSKISARRVRRTRRGAGAADGAAEETFEQTFEVHGARYCRECAKGGRGIKHRDTNAAKNIEACLLSCAPLASDATRPDVFRRDREHPEYPEIFRWPPLPGVQGDVRVFPLRRNGRHAKP
jgi:hypothetical protein